MEKVHFVSKQHLQLVLLLVNVSIESAHFMRGLYVYRSYNKLTMYEEGDGDRGHSVLRVLDVFV